MGMLILSAFLYIKPPKTQNHIGTNVHKSIYKNKDGK